VQSIPDSLPSGAPAGRHDGIVASRVDVVTITTPRSATITVRQTAEVESFEA